MMARLYDNLILLLVDLYCHIRYRKLIKRMRKILRKLGIIHRRPRIAVPQTGNEKFFWRKLFDHNPIFVTASDKLLCKQWIESQHYDLLIPATLWHGPNLQALADINATRDIVVKANHGSGTNAFIEKAALNQQDTARQISEWLAFNHGEKHHEWAYSKIHRRVFAEEWIRPETQPLTDIKLYLFSGKILRIAHISGGPAHSISNVWNLDADGELVPSEEAATAAPSDYRIALPPTIFSAIRIAEQIGQHFDHVRVDLLTDGTSLWFGELTLYNQGGYLLFPSASDPQSVVSRGWDIRHCWFLSNRQPGWRGHYARALHRRLRDS